MLYFIIWCYVFARCVIFCYIHPYRTAASAICLPTHRPPASMAAILGREPKDLSTKNPNTVTKIWRVRDKLVFQNKKHFWCVT